MSEFNPRLIQVRIRKVVRSIDALPDTVADDVAFHMTDWLEDLAAYYRFCADPNSMSDADLGAFRSEFLVHVPNHLAAASKLYTGVPVTDIFGVGATSEETDEVG